MNITDFGLTPMRNVHATAHASRPAPRRLIEDAELIGLIPEAAYEPIPIGYVKSPGFDPDAKVSSARLHVPHRLAAQTRAKPTFHKVAFYTSKVARCHLYLPNGHHSRNNRRIEP